MKLKRRWLLFVVCAGGLITTAQSNPIEPTPLTEIQVIDSSHWKIEVDLRGLKASQTDSITLFCGDSVGDKAALISKMITCTEKELFDTNGICLITEKNFPTLKLIKGKYLYLWKKGWPSSEVFGPVKIVNELTPENSLVNTGYSSPNYSYRLSTCPSLGIRNSEAWCEIIGNLFDKDSLPFEYDVFVTIKSGTDSSIARTWTGKFTLYVDACTPQHILYITDFHSGEPVSDTIIIKKLNFGQVESLTIKLKVSSITGIKKYTPVKETENIRILNSQAGHIAISVSDNRADRGEVLIYSLNGVLVRKIQFDIHGAGTYTVNWDGNNDKKQTVPTGTYTCRVQIGNESSCKNLINW